MSRVSVNKGWFYKIPDPIYKWEVIYIYNN